MMYFKKGVYSGIVVLRLHLRFKIQSYNLLYMIYVILVLLTATHFLFL